MDDTEREAKVRELLETWPSQISALALHPTDARFLLRLLDEARAESASLRAEIARLRAPASADAMEAGIKAERARIIAALADPSIAKMLAVAECFMSAKGISGSGYGACKCLLPEQCWNIDELALAEKKAGLRALADWLEKDPTGAGTP